MSRIAALLTALLFLGAGCGNSEKIVEPLIGKVDLARDAQSLSSLQQALTAAALVRSEAGGSYGSGPDDFVQRLQARDPSKRFGGAPSTGPEQIQVSGGGRGPMMLVARSLKPSDSYLAVWDNGTTTLYYRGVAPPQFTTDQPAGAGWTMHPPH